MAVKNILTDKEEAFCLEYVQCGVIADAVRHAYPASKKWKKSSVYSFGAKVLARAKVTKRIAYLRDAAAKREEISPDRVLREYSRIAFADLRDVLDDNGDVLEPNKWPKRIAKAISSIKVRRLNNECDVVEVTLWNKNKALSDISKFLHIFERDSKAKQQVVSMQAATANDIMQAVLKGNMEPAVAADMMRLLKAHSELDNGGNNTEDMLRAILDAVPT